MHQYQVISKSARISVGNVSLTGEQAHTRSHCLNHVEDDVYEIKSPIEFKKGETFGYDGTPGKGQTSLVMVEDEAMDDDMPVEKPKAKKKK